MSFNREKMFKYNLVAVIIITIIFFLNNLLTGQYIAAIFLTVFFMIIMALCVGLAKFIPLSVRISILVIGKFIISFLVLYIKDTVFETFSVFIIVLILTGLYFNRKIILIQGIVISMVLTVYTLAHFTKLVEELVLTTFVVNFLSLFIGIVLMYMIAGWHIASIEDVKRTSSQLELALQQANAASKSKSDFLSNMSHEIRTPLNAIIGMAGINKKAISDADCHKALVSIENVLTSSHHLLSILNYILDMSKIESGKLELMHEQFNLINAYSDLNVMIGQRCLDKNVKYITNIAAHKDMVLIGDKIKINQVLVNLLGNAVKFTPEDGEIIFTVDMVEETEENIKLHFSVTDTGIGMSESQIKRLFVPFDQTDSHITQKYGGTGLGLSISQKLINMMGGFIKVESELGRGSKFYFDLSFCKGETVEKTSDEYDFGNLKNKKILLVEDIEINRIIVKEILSTYEITVDEAENGQVAIEKFNDSPDKYYSLIFMDIQMPIMGGYEATKQIRQLAHSDAKAIPIIAMTANAFKEDVEAALASGMNGHIAKPVEANTVLNTLQKYI